MMINFKSICYCPSKPSSKNSSLFTILNQGHTKKDNTRASTNMKSMKGTGTIQGEGNHRAALIIIKCSNLKMLATAISMISNLK